MRKIKEVLRLHHEKGFSVRQIARSLSIGRSTVQDYLDRAQRTKLNWPLAAGLDETSLEQQLYPPFSSAPPEKRQMPSMDYLYQELKRKGVTLQLLWHEYKQAHPDGVPQTGWLLRGHPCD